MTAPVRHLFVYGTLQPGESRWSQLAPFVTDHGEPAAVAGVLYDTGLDYPAAIFSAESPSDLIRGRIYELRADVTEMALARLDAVEGAVRGLYHRVTVCTVAGTPAWAYECGDHTLLRRRLADGDWLQRAGELS